MTRLLLTLMPVLVLVLVLAGQSAAGLAIVYSRLCSAVTVQPVCASFCALYQAANAGQNGVVTTRQTDQLLDALALCQEAAVVADENIKDLVTFKKDSKKDGGGDATVAGSPPSPKKNKISTKKNKDKGKLGVAVDPPVQASIKSSKK